MTNHSLFSGFTLCVASFLGLGPTCPLASSQDQDSPNSPAIPAPTELIYVQSFESNVAMEFVVDGKAQKVEKGFVLVLKADPSVLEPKNAPDFLLFAGGCVAQRVNNGYRDGHLIVIVPEIDLNKDLVFFGQRLLTRELSPERVLQEQRMATTAKIRPFSKRALTQAQSYATAPLKVEDKNELWYETRSLILKYAPAESEMANSLRR